MAGWRGILEALWLWPSKPPAVIEHVGTVRLADSLRYTVAPVDALKQTVVVADSLRYTVAVESVV